MDPEKVPDRTFDETALLVAWKAVTIGFVKEVEDQIIRQAAAQNLASGTRLPRLADLRCPPIATHEAAAAAARTAITSVTSIGPLRYCVGLCIIGLLLVGLLVYDIAVCLTVPAFLPNRFEG
jgi:hypothetical protein